MPRLLLILPQLPQDPASGAARSVRTICEMLAAAGFEIRALATTNTERAEASDTVAHLKKLGIEPQVDRFSSTVAHEIDFAHRGVTYRLLETGQHISAARASRFDQMFIQELEDFAPDVVFGYGGGRLDRDRFKWAKRLGMKTVFALRNDGYLSSADFFEPMDAIVTPSRFLSRLYRNELGIESTAIPPPINPADVVADRRRPRFVTIINPSPEKGLDFFAALAVELEKARPDIQLMAVQARSSNQTLYKALGGPRRNVVVVPTAPETKGIYSITRTLLVPSLWQEPAGRVVAEALMNGIPPIVSDRGGLEEMRNGAGFCIPIPFAAVPEAVELWKGIVCHLEDDSAFYAQESRKAGEASQIYDAARLSRRYVSFFNDVIARR